MRRDLVCVWKPGVSGHYCGLSRSWQCFLRSHYWVDWKTVLVFLMQTVSSGEVGIWLVRLGMGISTADVGVEWFGKWT